jgi:hypothetical protein
MPMLVFVAAAGFGLISRNMIRNGMPLNSPSNAAASDTLSATSRTMRRFQSLLMIR